MVSRIRVISAHGPLTRTLTLTWETCQSFRRVCCLLHFFPQTIHHLFVPCGPARIVPSLLLSSTLTHLGTITSNTCRYSTLLLKVLGRHIIDFQPSPTLLQPVAAGRADHVAHHSPQRPQFFRLSIHRYLFPMASESSKIPATNNSSD